MLCVIGKEDWGHSIVQVRDGTFPSPSMIKEVEKRLITYLLSPMPQYRPQNMSTVIKIAGDLSKEGK